MISRTEAKRLRFCETYGIPSHAERLAEVYADADWVFLCVGDHDIPTVAKELAVYRSPHMRFVHCSGSAPLAALDTLGERTAVLYPMQIFTVGSLPAAFRAIPLFVEGKGEMEQEITAMAHLLSDRVQVLDSQARLRLHLGAVFVCNFPNYLYRLAEELVPGVGLTAYQHLIEATVEKALAQGPAHSQTGPAVRGDTATLYQHLEILQDTPKKRELYWLMSELIREAKEGEMENAES